MMYLFRLNDTILQSCALNETIYADDFRMGIVGYAGSAVAGISVIENAILFYIFSTSRKLRRQNYANPVLLALFDSIVSICYILTASVQVIGYRYQMEAVISTWAQYMRVVYCLQHFALTVSNFVLVVASIERFLANGSRYFEKRLLVMMVSNKAIVLAVIMVLSLLFKGTLYFETALLHLPHCPPIESFIPVWIQTGTAVQATRFWIRRIFTIIVPFFVLTFCNIHIVMHLRKRRRKFDQIITQTQRIATATTTNGAALAMRKSSRPASASKKTSSFKKRYNEKTGVRVATRTLAMVVGCYLISNTATTVINIWEYFDVGFVRYVHYYKYLVASDLAALLTIVGCALRLPIYIFNDHRIRKAIIRAVLRLRYRRSAKLDDLQAGALEKWSIVIVSNSIRSNLTGMLSQDWTAIKGKKSIEKLGLLVQSRRHFLVQMTINLGAAQATQNAPQRRHSDEFTGNETTFLTDIQEEEQSELLAAERRSSADYESLVSPTKKTQWRTWRFLPSNSYSFLVNSTLIMSVLKKVTCKGTFVASNDDIENPHRPINRCRGTVPYTDNLFWTMTVWLCGQENTDSNGFVTVHVTTSRNVDAAISLHLDSTGKTYRATLKNQNKHDFGPLQDYSVDFLSAVDLGKEEFHVTIDFNLHFLAMNHRFYESCEHVEKDFTLIVENRDIKVHRNYLALISPFFNSMLSHRTKEAKSNQFKIADFSMPTVHTVIRMCYGYFVTNIDVPLAIDMLRFVDKYHIKSVVSQLEAYLEEKLTPENFPTIVKYAFDLYRESLMRFCGNFYIKHQIEINKLREFVDMNASIIAFILRAAWKLQNPATAPVPDANNS
uniref:G_PROTEIN_RECEP_F1_2 domain-containing protein n=1 Tax=Panagrellus redivivus TaxID=6233 RepID=A0A7E4UW99_PANRE